MFVTVANAQNIDPIFIKKAKALGYTEAQITEMFSKQAVTNTQKVTSPTNISRTRIELDSTMVDTLNTKLINESIEIDRKKKLFGASIFTNKNLSFAPNLNIPTPKNYTLSAGDEIIINIWGSSEMNIQEEITPEGSILIPAVGPIFLSGLTIESASNKIKSTLKKIVQDIDVNSDISVSLGKIRSIKVNVTGEVKIPGSYTITSLSTVFHLLYLCGGVNDIGSLREINVYRDSKLFSSLDVYDYILKGDASKNVILKDGDIVIVPTYKKKISLFGAIKREMFYELKNNETLEQLIEYAGGFSSNAYKENVRIYRNSSDFKEILSVSKDIFGKTPINDGDSIMIDKQIDEYLNKVSITGAVWRVGDFQLDESTSTLLKLIKKAGGVKGNEFSTRGLIKRRNPDYTNSLIGFNTKEILSLQKDIDLKKNDSIYIPKIDDLKEIATISVFGDVNNPDTIPYSYNMRIEDVIILAGGLKESASHSVLEVSRRIKNPDSINYTSTIAKKFEFEINGDLTINKTSKDFVIEPFDEIFVRKSPQYSIQNNIKIQGEVVFPGTYTLEKNGSRISDIIKMTKGMTPEAYIKGASLKRKFTDDDNAQRASMVNMAIRNTEKDSVSIKAINLNEFYSIGIDLEKAIAHPGGKDDIILLDGDEIRVPKFTNIIKIFGEVNYPNAVTYTSKNLKKYINEAGDYKKNARKRPFVIYMNGKVKSTKKIFFIPSYPKIEPGCIIVVPTKAKSKGGMSITEIMSLVTGTSSLASSLATLGVSISK